MTTSKQHFTQLPEPPVRLDDSLRSRVKDDYLDGLENYIQSLHNHLLTIQKDETQARKEFAEDLKKLAAAKPGKKRANDEKEYQQAFTSRLKKIKSRRKHFRQMLFDAYSERKKLIESMSLQKHEEEVLRRKLQRISSVDSEPQSGAWRWLDFFFWIYAAFQIITVVIYWVACDFSDNPNDPLNLGYPERASNWYTIWVHVALLVLAGFAYLYSFMRKYAYTSITHVFLITVLAVQWTILYLIFWTNINSSGPWERGDLTILSLIDGYYGAAAVLVSFGVIVGIATPLQLVIITLLETGFYALNRYVTLMVLSAIDIGGSQTVHAFGAAYGLGLVSFSALTSWYFQEDVERQKECSKDRQPSYVSNTFAMVGTLIMFVTWPGWNAAYAPNGSQYRVVVNTFLSITSSAIMAFLTSRTIRGGKFYMADIQRATLAGGIAIGSATPIVVSPGGAMVIGLVAGVVSTLAIGYLSPALASIRFTDHASVISVNGLAGLLAGIAGIISAAISGQHSTIFGQATEELFPYGGSQAGYQTACIAISIGIGFGGGFGNGLVLAIFDLLAQCVAINVPFKLFYSDEREFHVPSDFERTLQEIEAKPADEEDKTL
jgi:ammonium transporter Rh